MEIQIITYLTELICRAAFNLRAQVSSKLSILWQLDTEIPPTSEARTSEQWKKLNLRTFYMLIICSNCGFPERETSKSAKIKINAVIKNPNLKVIQINEKNWF